MELKDMILATLKELEFTKDEDIGKTKTSSLQQYELRSGESPFKKEQKGIEAFSVPVVEEKKVEETPVEKEFHNPFAEKEEEIFDEKQNLLDKKFLENLRERILVLFEGFQSPNNVAVEAKVDLTLNFLEYLLATIDERLDQIKE